MDFFAAFQEYVFKTKNGRANGRDIAAEIGRARHRCSSHSYCCCCAGATRKRDSSTSTHDLSTYVWHTEGDGVGISSSITANEDDRCSCRTGSSCGRKDCSSCLHSQQSNRCTSEGQHSMCDASTSSFDLSTYVWGTDGDMYTTDSGVDDNSEAGGFVRDLGLNSTNCIFRDPSEYSCSFHLPVSLRWSERYDPACFRCTAIHCKHCFQKKTKEQYKKLIFPKNKIEQTVAFRFPKLRFMSSA